MADPQPSQKKETTHPGVFLACGVTAFVIFLIDLQVPLGIATGIPYIVVILLSLKSPENRFTLITACICTLLIILGYLGSPPAPEDVPLLLVFANRILTVAAIWTVAIMALIQRNQNHKLHQAQLVNLQSAKDAEIQAEKLRTLKATMRTVQDITGNFLNNLQYFTLEIEKNKTLSPESVRKLHELIHDTAERLNKLGNLEEIREKKMHGDMIGIDYEPSAKEDSLSESNIKQER